MEGKNTVQKLSPSLCIIHSSVLQVSLDMLNSGLTEQRTGQAFSLFSHLLSHFPSHHWSWRMPALVSSPRRIVTYGNAEDGDPGHYQVRRANSLMRTADCVIVPVSSPFLDQVYQALGSSHDWW